MELTKAVAVVRGLLTLEPRDGVAGSAETQEALRTVVRFAEGRCSHEACDSMADSRIFWPGRAPARMCPNHANAARAVANCMGFDLHVERCEP